MIGIIDYNAGNIKSVERSLLSLNAEYILSKSPEDLKNCSKIIFPGVGEAKYAMEQLKKTGFDSFIRDFYESGKPIIGICLGSQIIFDYSEEGDVECLGLIKGKIRHFSSVWKDLNIECNLKVPQIGWNDLTFCNGSSPYFEGIKEHSDFYFVHSYIIQPANKSVIKAFTDYGCEVPACVKQNNLTAFQFHPEKSGKSGLKILSNFINS